MAQPTLETKRLTLRPFTMADAPEVQRLAGDRRVAHTTARIPHPYEDGMAETWISTHQDRFEKREEVTFAVIRKEDCALVGAIGLVFHLFDNAEMGYWIGVPDWNQGYATEAAGALLKYGFEDLGLHRIQATHFTRNPASGRVMEKLGMKHEGRLRGYVRKWGVYEDVEMRSILRDEYSDRIPDLGGTKP